MKKTDMSADEIEMVKNEIKVLRSIDHPNILKIFEFFEDDSKVYIVTEICGGGEIFDEIIARGRFSERDAAIVIKHLLNVLIYCHENKIVHRDLKPENILLESDKT